MEIKKPIDRSSIRQKAGREYYILKRKINWIFGKQHFATKKENKVLKHSVYKHKSMILRPLQGVEMYLQENKRTNLELAIKHLNDIVIKPGETFSIWRLVGRPSKVKGYLEGLTLKQGQISKDTGGGLCQLGNLLFWIFAHSELTITERYRHGFDVFPDTNRNVPFGAGATLAYNHIDLQVKNETQNDFQIKLWLDSTHLNGELLSSVICDSVYTIEESDHIMKQQMWGRYSRHNRIIQVKNQNGHITEKLLVENHAIMMYSPFIEEKKKC
ncbi:VanW family protein [Crocinitomicaceae bacterium]|jgi:vancomycin resistance protein VanW|nr:VanW family protein [Crocinitomicaceae bacterium]